MKVKRYGPLHVIGSRVSLELAWLFRKPPGSPEPHSLAFHKYLCLYGYDLLILDGYFTRYQPLPEADGSSKSCIHTKPDWVFSSTRLVIRERREAPRVDFKHVVKIFKGPKLDVPTITAKAFQHGSD